MHTCAAGLTQARGLCSRRSAIKQGARTPAREGRLSTVQGYRRAALDLKMEGRQLPAGAIIARQAPGRSPEPLGGRQVGSQACLQSFGMEDCMHILETVVSRQAVPVVEFRGEGGEQVAVTLAAPELMLDDQTLIAKAKTMMARLGGAEVLQPVETFGLAGEPGRDRTYTLEYQDKGIVRALGGLSFPTVEAVAVECRRSAEDLWQDALSRGEAPVGWAVRARDGNGTIVATVDFAEFQNGPVESKI
jgi:hypothetical protein